MGDPVLNKLLWIDINRGKIFVYDETDETNLHIDLRQSVGTVVPYTEKGPLPPWQREYVLLISKQSASCRVLKTVIQKVP